MEPGTDHKFTTYVFFVECANINCFVLMSWNQVNFLFNENKKNFSMKTGPGWKNLVQYPIVLSEFLNSD